MAIALIVGFSLLLALEFGASALLYSNYIYCKNRVFSKTKYSILWIVICAIMVAFLLSAGVYFCIDLSLWGNSLTFSPVYIGLSFACLFLSIIYLIYFLILPKLTNKNKIDYKDIAKIDYQKKIEEIEHKIGDINALKAKLEAKHKTYYHNMLEYYETILNRAKNSQISVVEKMADIVTFNDAFTHKWCTFTNNYQILLTFQFCKIFQKFS